MSDSDDESESEEREEQARYEEYERLSAKRHCYLTPDCCDVVRRCKAIVMSVNFEENSVPYWHLRIGSNEFDTILRAAEDIWWRNNSKPFIPAPEFCPFCGKHVPAIVKRAEPLSPIMTCVDGGYYCNTCAERLMNCACWPAWFAWEVQK